MEILRRFIFGDVFDTGVLDDQTRELITVTVLACLQTLPQLKSHTAAALRVGVPRSRSVRPSTSSPRSSASRARSTPSPPSTTCSRTTASSSPCPRRAPCRTPTGTRGVSRSSCPCTGTRSRTTWPTCPQPFDEALPRFLTEFCFGDFYTRGGLTLAQRELLVLCALATIGDTAAQLGPHGRACLQVGNSKTDVVAALVHCFPYIGFPRSVAAVRAVKDLT